MSYPSTQFQQIDPAEMPKGIVISAPFTGTVRQLSVVNEPLLAGKWLGEGLAIELTANRLVAPFDGVIVEFPVTGHRITLKSSHGVQLLIALPWQSTELMGQGFHLQVKSGESIKKGQLLCTFNLQKLQQMNTPCYGVVLVTNAERLGNCYYCANKVKAGEDTLLLLTSKAATDTSNQATPTTPAK